MQRAVGSERWDVEGSAPAVTRGHPDGKADTRSQCVQLPEAVVLLVKALLSTILEPLKQHVSSFSPKTACGSPVSRA